MATLSWMKSKIASPSVRRPLQIVAATASVGVVSFMAYKLYTKYRQPKETPDTNEECPSPDPSIPNAAKASLFKENGNTYYRRKNYRKAIESYTKAIAAIAPANEQDIIILSKLYQNRAASHEMLGDWKKVLEDCNKALSIYPTYGKAYMRRAKAHLHFGNLSNAVSDSSCAVLINSGRDEAWGSVALEAIRQESERQAADILSRVGQAPSAVVDKTRDSNNEFSRYISELKMDPIFDYKNGGLPADLKHTSLQHAIDAFVECDGTTAIGKAVEFATLVAPIMEDHLDNYYLALAYSIIGTVKLILTEHDEAHANFNGAVDILEKRVESITGDDEKSDAIRRRCARLMASLLTKIGGIKFFYAMNSHSEDPSEMSDSQIEAPLVMMQQAIAADSTYVDAYLNRGQVYLLTGRWEEALQSLGRVLEILDTDSVVEAQREYCKFKFCLSKCTTEAEYTEKFDELLSEFRDKVVSLNVAEGYHYLAQVLCETKNAEETQFEEAMGFLNDGIKADPANPFSYMRLALLYQQLGDIELCCKTLRRVFAVNPRSIQAYQALINVYSDDQKDEEAFAVVEQAAKVGFNLEQLTDMLVTIVGGKAREDALLLLQDYDVGEKINNDSADFTFDTTGGIKSM